MKKTILSLIAAAGTLTAMAGPVSQSKAAAIAQQFFQYHGQVAAAKHVTTSFESAAKSTVGAATDNDPAYYVFNSGSGNGFVIVSGDDQLPQLIGYGTEGSWPSDESKIPTPLAKALNRYSSFVADLREGKVSAPPLKAVSSRPEAVVDQLMTTKWGQNYPYNMLAPEDMNPNCSNSYKNRHAIGCVATAFAQVLNYWGHKTGKPEHPATNRTWGIYEHYFSEDSIRMDTAYYTTSADNWYQYDNMPDSINPTPEETTWMTAEQWETQSQAVGQLLGDVAYALNMTWTDADGGQSFEAVAKQLGSLYFDFSLDTEYYSSTVEGALKQDKYFNMIKDDLDKGQPVIIGADDANGSGGHCFVFDGYDSNGYVHVNWGWNGTCDNWFSPDALITNMYDKHDPDEYIYTSEQGMVHNFHPRTHEETITLDDNDIVPDNSGVLIVSSKLDVELKNSLTSDLSLIKDAPEEYTCYIDRKKALLLLNINFRDYMRAYGSDYEIPYTFQKADETIVDTIHISGLHSTESAGKIDVTQNFTYNTNNLPDGKYGLISAKIRQSRNGVTGGYKDIPADGLTTIIKGKDIITNPEVYEKRFQADSCIHYYQANDSANCVMVHVDYNIDPKNVTVGDSLNMNLYLAFTGNSNFTYTDSDETKGWTIAIDGEHEVSIGDTEEDMAGLPANWKYEIENNESGSYVRNYIYTYSLYSNDPAKLQIKFTMPQLGIHFSDDIIIRDATGITELTDNRTADTTMYDLAGRCIKSARPGQLVIKGGKAILMK